MEDYDNTPNDATSTLNNSYAYQPNNTQVGNRMDGNMPKGNVTFEDQLMADYKNFVNEAEEKTMSKAAKGMMKYGKEGMKALAKAGKAGKDLDKVRDKYNKYDEASHQANVTMKHVNASDASPKVKAAIGKASKDIKPGVKGYADRAAALNAAGVKR